LIKHAKDNQGQPLFTLEDKKDFMHHADVRVIERVTSAILLDGGSYESEKKKLNDDPDYYFRFQLAVMLHKTVSEIESLPAKEYEAWKAYVVMQSKGKTHGSIKRN
jgi:hypothetical protein